MSFRTNASTSYRAVGWTFIFLGSLSLVGVVVRLFYSDLFFDFALVSLPVGVGLLNRRRVAWSWAVFIAALGLVVNALFIAALFLMKGPPVLSAFGKRVSDIPRPVALLSIIPFAALSTWQFLMLIRADVRRVYSPPCVRADLESQRKTGTSDIGSRSR